MTIINMTIANSPSPHWAPAVPALLWQVTITMTVVNSISPYYYPPQYLKDTTSVHGTVRIAVSVGSGPGKGQAWGCDLSYEYVKINAEYTT